MNSLISSLSALEEARAQVEKLQQQVASERRERLATIHTELGFGSRKELIDALVALGATRRGRRSGGTREPGPAAASRSKGGRIPAEMKAEIVKAIKAGESGVSVAERFGISLPSLHNIKKAAGLVRVRKGKARKRG